MTTNIKTIKLKDVTLRFYDGFVVSEIKEDAIFDGPKVDEVLEVCNRTFEEETFVYISERKNNYNVNPVIYFELKNVNTLAGIAIVSDRFEALKVANFEKQFSPVPFDIFSNMEEAQAWAKTLL